MLGELRGAAAAAGRARRRARRPGCPGRVIAGIGELACSVSGLQALEVNPLWVCGDQVEALDVLVVADSAAVVSIVRQ